MIKQFFTKQFLAFLAVGGVAAIMHWLSRILLSNWLSFSWAVVIAYAVGMLVAFSLNSYFVFPKLKKAKLKQARDFVLVNFSFFPVVWLASISINHALQALGMMSYTQTFAHGIAVGIPMIVTFLIYKFFIFKDIRNGQ
ncbi:MAG: GtrA family protein [Chlorobium sp.]|nr:GtrA family protein [Chlorobium sp.]